MILGEGQGALSLAVGVIALWLFPVPAVVYIYYLMLLGLVEEQARRWLGKFLTTWPRLIVCAAFSLGCIAGAWQINPPEPNIFIADALHPSTFSFYTLMLTGVWLFWLCIWTARAWMR